MINDRFPGASYAFLFKQIGRKPSLEYLLPVIIHLIILVTTLFLLIGCLEPENPPSVLEVSSGRVERIENFESKFVTPRNIDVWLPAGYRSRKKYAVLYMHDGQMLYDTSITWNKQEWGVDETMSELISKGKINDCMVVGIWNGGKERHSDYFPQKPFKLLPAQYRDSLQAKAQRVQDNELFSIPIQSDNYLKFLVQELKPMIDQTYSTKKEKEHTFVAGSSMGGLISMYALCEYPEIFGGAACISTHWPGTFDFSQSNLVPGAFISYMKNNLPPPQQHKIYFDYGTETIDSVYEPFQLRVDQLMMSLGYGSEQWKTLKFEGANHSEDSWNKRLHIPVTFLLKK